MSDNSGGGGCSSCLFLIALVILGMVFVPKICSGTEEIAETAEKVVSPLFEKEPEMNYEAGTPEYSVESFAAGFRNSSNDAVNYFSVDFMQEVSEDVKEWDKVVHEDAEFKVLLGEQYNEIIVEYSYQIHPAVYESENKAAVAITMNYTDIKALTEKAAELCVEHADKLDRMDKEPTLEGELLMLGHFVEEQYPKFKNKKSVDITFALVKENGVWVIDHCDDPKGMLNAFFAGIMY